MAQNTLIGWLYREIDLSQITVPIWRLPVRPSESYDWILNQVRIEYDSDNEDPSSFDNLQWRIWFPQQNRALQDISDYKPRPPVTLTCCPGRNDLTAGTTRPKVFYFPNPRIDWPIIAFQSLNLELEGHSGLTAIVRVLFMGEFVLPKNPYVNAQPNE